MYDGPYLLPPCCRAPRSPESPGFRRRAHAGAARASAASGGLPQTLDPMQDPPWSNKTNTIELL